MRGSTFFLILLLVNVLCLLCLYLLTFLPTYVRYLDLPLGGLLVFNLFNLIIYFVARRLSNKSDDHGYMRLVFMNFIIKLIIVIGMPLGYYFVKSPEESLFVVPFVLIYVLFTIFETWYLNKGAIMRFR